MHLEHDITFFVALFSVMNPLGAIPLFLAVTSGNPSKRPKVALQAGLTTVLILLVSYFVGDAILALFRIEMDAFRIAGSVLIAAAGWAMVMGRISTAYGEVQGSPATIPLSIPWLAGPGAIAVVIALGQDSIWEYAVEDVVIIVLLGTISTVLMLLASPIARVLREEGLDVISRLFGLILLAIAIGSILTALSHAFPGLVR